MVVSRLGPMKSITMAFLSAALSTPSFPAARTEAAQRPGFTLSGRSECM
jgi:hypothetical protein